MAKSLYCNRCRVRLTAPLTIRSGKDPAVAAPDVRDKAPLVPPGIGFKSWEPQRWTWTEPGHPLHFVPQYWLNPEDLTDAVRDTGNLARLGGCCGPTGMNGPNQICRCKAEIGTLQHDCITPHVFIPEPATTMWQDGSEDYWNYT